MRPPASQPVPRSAFLSSSVNPRPWRRKSSVSARVHSVYVSTRSPSQSNTTASGTDGKGESFIEVMEVYTYIT
jgi:hypothetical protein